MKLNISYLTNLQSKLQEARAIIQDQYIDNQKIVDEIAPDDYGLSLIATNGAMAVILRGLDGIINALDNLTKQ